VCRPLKFFADANAMEWNDAATRLHVHMPDHVVISSAGRGQCQILHNRKIACRCERPF
jgi:hypothetical protein